MKSESKSWQRFEGKLRSLKQYLQLMDLSLTLSNKLCNDKKDEEITIGTVLGATHDSHRQLNNPNLSKEIRRTFISARRQLNEQGFIELHCLFSNYIANIIAEIAHGEPKRLVGILGNKDTRTIKFAEIIHLGSYEAVINEMAKRVFRILENLRSTSDMMKKLIKITGITIDKALLEEALIYVEVRHLIIHNDSFVDDPFILNDKNKSVPLNGKKLALTYTSTNKATNTIYKLCKKIDEELIKKGLIPIRPQLPARQ